MGEREKLIEDAAIYAECSMADATQKYQSSAKQKAAYRAVRSAMESGALVRPASCEKCGKEPPPARDGRSKIHAHHHDYDKPLCVEWICALCHRKETPLHKHLPPALRGSKNPAAKLTAEDVLSIRELRAGGMPQYKIAALYGVERTCVRQICSGQTWGWLSASPCAKEIGRVTVKCSHPKWWQRLLGDVEFCGVRGIASSRMPREAFVCDETCCSDAILACDCAPT